MYRAIDSDGNLVDVFLSATRDRAAAETFFRSAIEVTGITPETITTDKHAGYPPATDELFGEDVEHRKSKYKNNHLEQDHRGVKGRTRPMRGFKSPVSAARLCRAYDEVRNFLRPAPRRKQHVPAARRRAIHVQRVAALRDILAVASFTATALRAIRITGSGGARHLTEPLSPHREG
ncbi:DDE-type integrase/transposase/recombinase [Azospirillum sp. A29]|uniref:transposase n=1 Tax=Azospirillum sp. A29 TaxID=3160606 RepID=UPI00366B9DC2